MHKGILLPGGPPDVKVHGTEAEPPIPVIASEKYCVGTNHWDFREAFAAAVKLVNTSGQL